MKFNNRQTNGKIIYRIDDHWSDESLQKSLDFYHKQQPRNLRFYIFTFMPYVVLMTEWRTKYSYNRCS